MNEQPKYVLAKARLPEGWCEPEDWENLQIHYVWVRNQAPRTTFITHTVTYERILQEVYDIDFIKMPFGPIETVISKDWCELLNEYADEVRTIPQDEWLARKWSCDSILALRIK